MLFLPFWINWINWTTELLNSVSLPILLLGLFRIQLLRLCIQLLRLCKYLRRPSQVISKADRESGDCYYGEWLQVIWQFADNECVMMVVSAKVYDAFSRSNRLEWAKKWLELTFVLICFWGIEKIFGFLLTYSYLWLRRKYSRSKKPKYNLAFCSLIRTFDLSVESSLTWRYKVWLRILTLENPQIHLVFYSLIRTFAEQYYTLRPWQR